MDRRIILKLFLLSCVISVAVQNDLGNCEVSVVELNDMLAMMTAAQEGNTRVPENVNFVSDCDTLTKNLIGVSSRKRNLLKKRRAETSRIYNETETAFINQQKEKTNPLRDLPAELKEEYQDTFEILGAEVKAIRASIDSELRNRAVMEEKIGFYRLLSSLSSESSDTLCSLNKNNGRQLIATMQENFLLLTGTNFTDKCKVLVNKMTNIKSFEDKSFQYEEQRLELLNRTFAERLRVLDILVKDNEETLRDFRTIKQDKFDRLTHFRDEMFREVANVKADLVQKASDFAVKMLQNGVRFDEVTTALEDAKNDVFNPLKLVLENAYTCKVNYLRNIVRFTHGHSWTGFPIILEKMKTCEQLDDPIVLEIAQLYKDDRTESLTDKAYKKFAEKIRSNEIDSVVATLKDLKADDIDYARIVRFSYDGDTKNFLPVTQFIEKLGTKNQNLEEVLYNEMIRSGHEDTKEHIMFGIFIKKLIWQAYKASDDSRKRNLETVKSRLPEGIRNLCFSMAVFFLADDFTTFGKPTGYKALPFSGGQMFQFQRADQAGKFLYAGVNDFGMIPAHGPLENHEAFFWRIKPMDKAKYFQVINRANSFSLNTIKIPYCAEKGWWSGKCSKWSDYYLLKNSQEPAQNMMIKGA